MQTPGLKVFFETDVESADAIIRDGFTPLASYAELKDLQAGVSFSFKEGRLREGRAVIEVACPYQIPRKKCNDMNLVFMPFELLEKLPRRIVMQAR